MKKTALLLLLFTLLLPVMANAQEDISSTIAKLEKSGKLPKQMFSEKRDPSTGTLISSSSIYEFTDNASAKRIIESFEKSREKAASFKMINNKRDTQYFVTFVKKQYVTSYTLICSNNKKVWSLYVKIKRDSKCTSQTELRELPTSFLQYDTAMSELRELPESFLQPGTAMSELRDLPESLLQKDLSGDLQFIFLK